MQFISIGFGNIISKNRVVAVVSPESSPIKRVIQDAKENRKIIDATCGRKTRAVIFMDSGHIVLTALQTDTILQRTEKINKK